MPELPRELPHLYLNGGGRPEEYTSKGRGSTPPAPARDRALHAQHLQQAFTAALNAATAQLPAAAIANGIYLDFELPHGTQAFVEKLEDRRKHIELIAVTQGPLPDSPVRATVFVPSAAADHYQRKITAYQEQETKSGKPKNEPLIARINTIQLSAFRSVYTDDPNMLPEPHQPTWWEVWLRHGQYEEFAHAAAQLNIPVRPQRLHFAEREVILALANQITIGQLFITTQTIAEIRIARDNPTLFVQMNNVDQAAWVADLSGRLQPPPAQAPTVCILDSGITSAHPLLAPAIDPQDVHRYDPTWPAGDSAYWNGHGTAMSGIALYGNLQTALESQAPFALDHRLEAVTMLAPDGAQHEPRLYGAITAECIARAEIQAPQRSRVVCMAVTSSIDTLRGQPSSWSAAVDNICFGDNQNQQLLMISAGNIREDIATQEYPAANDTATIENPGQAWNALTVGAHTERVNITDPTYAGWTPIAPAGDLSPTSRTSTTWQRQWPIKPEIVMEGGNWATNGDEASPIDDLCVLSTHYRPNVRHLQTFAETSAATALASNLAARLLAARPQSWPETIRALIVHSAEWTPRMKEQFANAPTQAAKAALLRRYGYGVPDYMRAIRSARNDMTLAIQDELQPYWKDNDRIKTRHLNLHELPWPRAELQTLGETIVGLRITLSYFIEPNPGERGWLRRHRYQSHGLRFALKRTLESTDEFRRRINRAVQADEEDVQIPDTDDWFLGGIRDAGSIHSDYWTGTAADLAARDAVAVFPVTGWWRDKPALERFNRRVRYALIVTIQAHNGALDIYTPVANQIAIPLPAE